MFVVVCSCVLQNVKWSGLGQDRVG